MKKKYFEMNRRIIGSLLTAVLLSGMCLMSGCGTRTAADGGKEDSGQQEDVTYDNEESHSQEENPTGADSKELMETEKFYHTYMDFSLELLKGSREKKNAMVSPLSVATALEMVRSGAKGETEQEIRKVLYGDLANGEDYLYNFQRSLKDDKTELLKQANSIWLKDDKEFERNESFLNNNQEQYQAELFIENFDKKIVDKINQWVSDKTNGMIDEILDKVDKDSVMYVINALYFEAEWSDKYQESAVRKEDFTTDNAQKVQVDMMHSTENIYLENDNATGFIKPYDGYAYSYVAIRPDDDITLEEFLNGLSGKDLYDMITNRADDEIVYAALPKYSAETDKNMVELLSNMGMPTAFGETADFSGIGTYPDDRYLYIGRLLHKTKIEVTESGTKAAAVTMIDMKCGNALMENEPKKVTLDRPFLYMIVDKQTNLPIFIGTVDNPE